ncbi:MAG: copper chaperone PCu(A)C [Campylobacteraceae bacterium]|nr:copper chaperone PCu(A)C [Campylobacteraceae bacterium]
MLKKVIVSLFILCSFSFSNEITIENSYIRAIAPGLTNSAAFMSINNNSKENIFLVKVKSNIAKNVEMHTASMKNGMMSMYQVPKIEIKAHSKTMLKPGSFHIMLINLNKKLIINDKYKFTFIFSNKKELSILIPVKKIMHNMKKMNKHTSHNMKNSSSSCVMKKDMKNHSKMHNKKMNQDMKHNSSMTKDNK